MMSKKRQLGQEIIQGNKRELVTQIDATHIDPSYVGTFKFHHPTVMENMRIGVVKSQLLGGLTNVDVLTDNIAHMVATLSVVLDSKPDWFDVENMYDYELLEIVYDKYAEWYNSFRKRG